MTSGNNFNQDLTDSIRDFSSIVLPKLKEIGLIKGELIPIETVTTHKDLIKWFDLLSGVDIWQIIEDQGIRGIANRIQWGKKAWDTFTIRKHRHTQTKTEYVKRKEAINSGGSLLYPYYTIQSYISERRTGELLSTAIAKTDDIIKMCDSGHWQVRERTTKSDGNIFVAVPWSLMKASNCRIGIWHKSTTTDNALNEIATQHKSTTEGDK